MAVGEPADVIELHPIGPSRANSAPTRSWQPRGGYAMSGLTLFALAIGLAALYYTNLLPRIKRMIKG